MWINHLPWNDERQGIQSSNHQVFGQKVEFMIAKPRIYVNKTVCRWIKDLAYMHSQDMNHRTSRQKITRMAAKHLLLIHRSLDNTWYGSVLIHQEPANGSIFVYFIHDSLTQWLLSFDWGWWGRTPASLSVEHLKDRSHQRPAWGDSYIC